MVKEMVGTWGLEPQTSTVSTPEFEVNRCTYKALVATKSPVGYGSSFYCGLNVSIQTAHCALFTMASSGPSRRRKFSEELQGFVPSDAAVGDASARTPVVSRLAIPARPQLSCSQASRQ